MSAKTTHVLPSENGWIVRKERPSLFVGKRRNDRALKRPNALRTPEIYPTQKEAVEAAQKLAGRSTAGQIVVHTRNGSIRRSSIWGLPAIQTAAKKSKLGTKAIERAVSTVIRERLERE